MKRLLCILCMSALAGVLPAQDEKKDKEKPPPSWEGTWQMTWGSIEGRPVPFAEENYWSIDAKNNVIAHFGKDPNQNFSTFSIVIDPMKKHIDRKQDDRVTLGLYEFRGDELVVCLNFKGKDRPFAIESNPTYGFTVYRFKRAKPMEKK